MERRPPSKAEVDAYFAPLGDDELTLPAPREKYLMRQTRDGAVELVDRSPPSRRTARFAAAIASVAGRRRSSGTCARWPGSGSARGCSTGRSSSASFPAPGISRPWRCRCRRRSSPSPASISWPRWDLWLAAPWGGAIWLLCAVVEAASPFLSPARGVDRLFRRVAQRRADRRLFPPELARGARARLTPSVPQRSSRIPRGRPSAFRPYRQPKQSL